jgi:hypothetical protein
MANVLLAEVPNGLAGLCAFAALSIGMVFGILIMCALITGARGNHGP